MSKTGHIDAAIELMMLMIQYCAENANSGKCAVDYIAGFIDALATRLEEMYDT